MASPLDNDYAWKRRLDHLSKKLPFLKDASSDPLIEWAMEDPARRFRMVTPAAIHAGIFVYLMLFPYILLILFGFPPFLLNLFATPPFSMDRGLLFPILGGILIGIFLFGRAIWRFANPSAVFNNQSHEACTVPLAYSVNYIPPSIRTHLLPDDHHRAASLLAAYAALYRWRFNRIFKLVILGAVLFLVVYFAFLLTSGQIEKFMRWIVVAALMAVGYRSVRDAWQFSRIGNCFYSAGASLYGSLLNTIPSPEREEFALENSDRFITVGRKARIEATSMAPIWAFAVILVVLHFPLSWVMNPLIALPTVFVLYLFSPMFPITRRQLREEALSTARTSHGEFIQLLEELYDKDPMRHARAVPVRSIETSLSS